MKLAKDATEAIFFDGDPLDIGVAKGLQQLLARRPRRRLAQDRGGGVDRNGVPALGAVHRAQPREQQPQVIVDLGRGSHGRACAAGTRGLLEIGRAHV